MRKTGYQEEKLYDPWQRHENNELKQITELMNITREDTDELNAVLTVKIDKTDYEERVNNVLNDYRKKARFDGFRPGKVPIGIINKMYRKPVLIEEVNKILGESVAGYFAEEKLYIIGEPLPHEDDTPEFDWDRDSEFIFSFDIALAPDIDISVSEKDKIPFYTIKIDDEVRNKHIDQIKSRFGTFKETDKISGSELVKAELSEVDKEGNPVEGGVKIADGSFQAEYIKDKKIKDKLAGCKSGDKVIADLKKAFPNETDLAALLKIDKDKLSDIKNDFQISITSISVFEKAEINQDLYDKLYGKDAVKSEEEFKNKIDEELKVSFENESDYRFRIDAKESYLKRFKKSIPDEFYKRWLLHVHEGKLTKEQLEKDYDQYVTDLKWQLIKSNVVSDNDLKVSEEELIQHVSELYRMQFIQYYGVANIPDESLQNYAKEALKKEDERRKFNEMVMEKKIFELIKNTVKLDPKKVTVDQFQKLPTK